MAATETPVDIQPDTDLNAAKDKLSPAHQLDHLISPWTRLARGRREVFQMLSTSQDRAIKIFKVLQRLEFERAPRIVTRVHCVGNCDQVVFKYPRHFAMAEWLGIHLGAPAEIVARDLVTVQEQIFRDIDLLYKEGVPYTPDLTRLLVTLDKSGNLQPFIRAHDFDYSSDVDDPRGMVLSRKAEIGAQFEVFSFLHALSRATSPEPARPAVSTDPRIMSKILQVTGLLIGQLNSHSFSLWKFLTDISRRLASHIISRKEVTVDEWKQDRIHEYLMVNYHGLRLLGESLRQYRGEGTEYEVLLFQRAALLAIRAIMLIYLHAKVNPASYSLSLLEESIQYTADAYTTPEGYDSVTFARQMAKEAISGLSQATAVTFKFAL